MFTELLEASVFQAIEMKNNNIYCVIVTFNPSEELLLKVTKSIKINTQNIIIINNGKSINLFENQEFKKIELINCNKNIGIASDQNLGIQIAKSKGAEFIWLSDQDTIYPNSYILQMMHEFHEKKASIGKICALAPAYFDTHKNSIQPFITHNPLTKKFSPTKGINLISHSISSGMIIPIKALEEVGLMQENLFIDWVDLEWCWRAKNIFGYQTIGNGDVIIQHILGDQHVKFLGKKVSFRSPIRHYYMVRNAVHIALHSRSATAPIRCEIFAKALAWTLIFPLIAPSQKRQHLRATLSGLWDGLRNSMGQKTLA